MLHAGVRQARGAEDLLLGRFAAGRRSWTRRAWRITPNAKHHGYTNVAGKDPDLHWGPVRLTEETPHRWMHFFQVPFSFGVLSPNLGLLMAWHVTGLDERYFGTGRPEDLGLMAGGGATRGGARSASTRLPVLELRVLSGAGRPDVLEGHARQLPGRDHARRLCGRGRSTATTSARTSELRRRSRASARARRLVCAAGRGHQQPRGEPSALDPLRRPLDRHIEHHLFPTLPPGACAGSPPRCAPSTSDTESRTRPIRGRTLKKASPAWPASRARPEESAPRGDMIGALAPNHSPLHFVTKRISP